MKTVLPRGAGVILRHSRAKDYAKAAREWQLAKTGPTYNRSGVKDELGGRPIWLFPVEHRVDPHELHWGIDQVVAHGCMTKKEAQAAIKTQAEAHIGHYENFSEKYVALRLLSPMLTPSARRSLDTIEVNCREQRALTIAEITWLGLLFQTTIGIPITARQVDTLFPQQDTWRRRAYDTFTDLTLQGTRLRDILMYPQDQHGKRFSVGAALELVSEHYAPTVGIKVEPLDLDFEHLPVRNGEFSCEGLARLIGSNGALIHKSVDREADVRLSPYLLPYRRSRGESTYPVFCGAAVRQDWRFITRLFTGPQSGEMSIYALADTTGITLKVFSRALGIEGDTRLDPYLLPHTRNIRGEQRPVFDEAVVTSSLPALADAFQGFQESELSVAGLAGLIGCSPKAISGALTRKGDTRLDTFRSSQDRVIDGKSRPVFDGAAVRKGLSGLKESFSGAQEGELTVPDLAAKIGCAPSTVATALSDTSDQKLTDYVLPHTRYYRGGDRTVFDAKKVEDNLE